MPLLNNTRVARTMHVLSTSSGKLLSPKLDNLTEKQNELIIGSRAVKPGVHERYMAFAQTVDPPIGTIKTTPLIRARGERKMNPESDGQAQITSSKSKKPCLAVVGRSVQNALFNSARGAGGIFLRNDCEFATLWISLAN